MSKFMHDGVEITLDGTGKFVADLNGTRIARSSIDAVKKAITQGKAAAFEPFDALLHRRSIIGKPVKGLKNWRSVRIVNIVVSTRRRSRYGGQQEEVIFIDSDRNRLDRVYEDTPEMRKIAAEEDAHDAEIEKRRNADEAKASRLAKMRNSFALDKTGKRIGKQPELET